MDDAMTASGGRVMHTEPAADSQAQPASREGWALAAARMLAALAGEMVAPVRAIFLATVLLVPLPIIGLIEAVGDTIAGLLSIARGATRGRPVGKGTLVAGYALGALARPLLAVAGAWPQVLALVFGDGVGRGLRARRADGSERALPGKHLLLAGLGAVGGPLVASGILLSTGNTRDVFLWSAVPGVLALALVVALLRGRTAGAAFPAQPAEAERESVLPGARFWMFTAIATVFALGRSSEAFLLLRTINLGEALAFVPLAYCGHNVVHALLAGKAEALQAKWGKLPLLISGYVVFGVVYACSIVSTQAWNAWVLFALFGVYTAASGGVGRALAMDLAPGARGQALAWYSGLTGLAALPANMIAGWMWVNFGPQGPFHWGMYTSVVAVCLLVAWLPWLRRGHPR